MTKVLNYEGESLTLSQWAEKLGIPRGLISVRLNRGWDAKQALTTPKFDNMDTTRPHKRADAEAYLSSLERSALPEIFNGVKFGPQTSSFGFYLRYRHPKLFDKWFKEEYPKIHESKVI